MVEGSGSQFSSLAQVDLGCVTKAEFPTEACSFFGSSTVIASGDVNALAGVAVPPSFVLADLAANVLLVLELLRDLAWC